MLIKTLFVPEILIDDCQQELKVPAINKMGSISRSQQSLMLLTNFHPQTNASTTFKFLFNFKHGREEKVGLFWHSGRRNYVIANKVRSLKLHLNRDRARGSEGGLAQATGAARAVWVALAVQVCFRGNNKPLSEGGETREPPWLARPHTSTRYCLP